MMEYLSQADASAVERHWNAIQNRLQILQTWAENVKVLDPQAEIDNIHKISILFYVMIF